MLHDARTVERLAGRLRCPRCKRSHCRVLVADRDGLCCKRCATLAARGFRWDPLALRWWRVADAD